MAFPNLYFYDHRVTLQLFLPINFREPIITTGQVLVEKSYFNLHPSFSDVSLNVIKSGLDLMMWCTGTDVPTRHITHT